jgi:hypothetical protein
MMAKEIKPVDRSTATEAARAMATNSDLRGDPISLNQLQVACGSPSGSHAPSRVLMNEGEVQPA